MWLSGWTFDYLNSSDWDGRWLEELLPGGPFWISRPSSLVCLSHVTEPAYVRATTSTGFIPRLMSLSTEFTDSKNVLKNRIQYKKTSEENIGCYAHPIRERGQIDVRRNRKTFARSNEDDYLTWSWVAFFTRLTTIIRELAEKITRRSVKEWNKIKRTQADKRFRFLVSQL